MPAPSLPRVDGTPQPAFAGRVTRHWLVDVALITVLFALYFGFQLGERAIWNPDEGRYSEIPREMLVSGDFITPHLDGVKYFEKPPLFYWLQAGSIKAFGIHEWSLRLWPVAFSLFGCLAVYGAGRRLRGRSTGLLSALVLATSLLYYFLGRAVILDMAVSVLIALAMLAFMVGVRAPPGRERRNYLWAFYVLMALATLTKGLIGIVIPGMVIAAWIALLGEWRLLKSIYLPSGLALYLLVAAPWHILVSIPNPEFPYFYFVQQHILRYLTTIEQRYQPPWFFIPILLLGMVPWTAFFPQALKDALPARWRERQAYRDNLFLVLWAALVFVFFSLSDSKLVPYILPVFPPLALLVGQWLAGLDGVTPTMRRSIAVLSLLALAGAVYLALLPHGLAHTDSTREFVHAAGDRLYVAAAALGLAAVVPYALARAGALQATILSLAVLYGGFNIGVSHALVGLDHKWSVKSMAELIKPRLKPGDAVATFENYYQDLPVYLKRRIIIVNWKNELSFGAKYQDTSDWMISTARFWKMWNSDRRVYVFANASLYRRLISKAHGNYRVLARNRYRVLLTNRPGRADTANGQGLPDQP